MSNTQTVYVLDMIAEKVKFFDVPRGTNEDTILEYMEDLGIDSNDCSWMVCDTHEPQELHL